MKRAKLPEPEFELSNFFTTRLLRPQAWIEKEKIKHISEKTVEKILKAINENPEITINDLKKNHWIEQKRRRVEY